MKLSLPDHSMQSQLLLVSGADSNAQWKELDELATRPEDLRKLWG